MNPRFDSALFYRGLCRYYSGDTNGALLDFNRTIRVSPKYGPAYYQLGVVEYYRLNYDTALALFHLASKYLPNRKKYYFDYAQFSKGKPLDSKNAYVVIQDRDYFMQLTRGDIYFYTARINEELGRYRKAEADYFQDIRYDIYSSSYSYIASLRLNRKDTVGAERVLKEGIRTSRLHNQKGYLQLELASLYFLQRKFIDVYRTLTPVIYHQYDKESNAFVYSIRAFTWAKKGNLHAAILDLDTAILYDGSHSYYYYERGDLKDSLSLFNSAESDFSVAIKLSPDSASYYHRRGYVRDKLGNSVAAIEDYTKTIELDSKAYGSFHNRALLKAELGDLTGAIADFTSAISLIPKNGLAYFYRGIYKREAGVDDGCLDIKEAIALGYFDRAVFRGNPCE